VVAAGPIILFSGVKQRRRELLTAWPVNSSATSRISRRNHGIQKSSVFSSMAMVRGASVLPSPSPPLMATWLVIPLQHVATRRVQRCYQRRPSQCSFFGRRKRDSSQVPEEHTDLSTRFLLSFILSTITLTEQYACWTETPQHSSRPSPTSPVDEPPSAATKKVLLITLSLAVGSDDNGTCHKHVDNMFGSSISMVHVLLSLVFDTPRTNVSVR
jgi:hypothetical protein